MVYLLIGKLSLHKSNNFIFNLLMLNNSVINTSNLGRLHFVELQLFKTSEINGKQKREG